MNVLTRPAGFLAGCGIVRLRRDGCAPLRFSGRLIARHDGQLRSAALWHDLALYRTATGDYAVEIVAMLAGGSLPRPARCHAALAETLDGALTVLERHDAAGDVCPGESAPALALDNQALSPAALLLAAASLHCACQDVVRRYRIGVGAFLGSLGMQDV